MGLILTRKPGQSVFIRLEDGRELEIEYVENRGRNIRLAFHIPPTVEVFRDDHPSRRTSGEDEE